MKAIIALILVLCMAAIPVMAQGYSGPKGIPGQGLNDASRNAASDKAQQRAKDSGNIWDWDNYLGNIEKYADPKAGIKQNKRDNSAKSGRGRNDEKSRPGTISYDGDARLWLVWSGEGDTGSGGSAYGQSGRTSTGGVKDSGGNNIGSLSGGIIGGGMGAAMGTDICGLACGVIGGAMGARLGATLGKKSVKQNKRDNSAKSGRGRNDEKSRPGTISYDGDARLWLVWSGEGDTGSYQHNDPTQK